MQLHGTVPRRISELLPGLAAEEPVVALHGPRSVGKSTVLGAFARAHGQEVLDLDDVAVREAVWRNPSEAVRTGAPLCVDEYQRVPDILDAIKARLNREGSLPGTAVITGSTRQDALPTTAQALTGRLHPMVIWPLSQGELEGVRENLLEALLADPDGVVPALSRSETSRMGYVDRVCSGGMPMALQRSGAARNRWFDNFVRASLERDAAELAQIRQRQGLSDLLRMCAAQTGQLLNVSSLAEELTLNRATVESYLRLLEDLFLVLRLPAWGKGLRPRASVKPKLHVVDSGLAARLMRISPDRLHNLDPTALTHFGHLLETFAVGELRKQASWLEAPLSFGHWRTGGGAEVDLIIERDDGRVLAFEVKAAERVPGADFQGLTRLRDTLGDRFLGGIVLHLGSRPYTYEDRLHVLPLDALWSPVKMAGV